MKFIGRERELSLLRGLTQKKSASLVVIKGRRRIGKSRLIQEFGKEFKTCTFTGLPPTEQSTNQSQLDEFSRQLSENFSLPRMQFADWGDLFSFLGTLTQEGKILIVFDEISWIGTKDHDFLGKIKNLWDLKLSRNPHLMFILCGSISSWIDHHILKSTGFVGRISATLTLGELSLQESNQFFGPHREKLSDYEKLKILSITGGVPKYLEEIRPQLSAEENVKNLCFSPSGYLFHEFDRLFHDVFIRKSSFYKSALEILVDGPKSPKDICDQLDTVLNSATSAYLDELAQAGFIQRDYIWHMGSKKPSKLSHYRLKDNYVRFYLKYIRPNAQKIENNAFEDKSIGSLPGWSSILGLQFENLVLNNRQLIWKLLHIHPQDIVWDNPFFQTKSSKRDGCQIDYLIQTKYSNLYVCEIKFLLTEVKADIVPEVSSKIKALQIPRGFSYRPVLIHVNGVDEKVLDLDYFSDIISFGNLLHA
ncbi:MAG: ATP-binding protein [Verrucomicrobia bacterium]|nr:ATP-binding protein [Verrucomicrobiota bacterium]